MLLECTHTSFFLCFSTDPLSLRVSPIYLGSRFDISCLFFIFSLLLLAPNLHRLLSHAFLCIGLHIINQWTGYLIKLPKIFISKQHAPCLLVFHGHWVQQRPQKSMHRSIKNLLHVPFWGHLTLGAIKSMRRESLDHSRWKLGIDRAKNRSRWRWWNMIAILSIAVPSAKSQQLT